MAFWRLYKWFAPWSRRNYPDMIYWYREYVLKTPEQRHKEEAQRKYEARTALASMLAATAVIGSRTGYF